MERPRRAAILGRCADVVRRGLARGGLAGVVRRGLALWTPIAEQYGLPVYQYSQI